MQQLTVGIIGTGRIGRKENQRYIYIKGIDEKGI